MTNALGPLLSSPPPTLGTDALADLLHQHWGMVGGLKPLTSERDLNMALTTDGGRFVVKIANPAEPGPVTDFQTAALLHLEGKGLPVPRVIRSLTGASAVQTPHGLMRVLTYLDGMPQHMASRTDAQRGSLGQMAARITQGLQGFAHPAADHVLQWDIRQASALRPMLTHVPKDLRPLCSATLNRFDAEIAPALPALRWQVVHNDLNPHNVLVDAANPDQISGVLDFGDMVRTPLVCDLAVAASYQIDPAAPLQSLMAFAAAYHRTLPLLPAERDLVADLTATRMLTTLCITSWRAARYPDNARYILRNFASAQDGLQALAALPRAEVQTALTAACPME